MSHSKLPIEVDELSGRLLDGAALSPSEEHRLQTLLMENADLLDQFVVTTALANDLQHLASLAVSVDGESKQYAKSSIWTAQGFLTGGLGVSVLALAASLVILALSIGFVRQGASAGSQPSRENPEFVATVVSQDGWAESATYPVGSRIPSGALTIERGVVQLQLDSGPNLLLEGPASLDIKSISEAHLAYGKLVFRDESGGDPFRLSTPWSQLMDQGTEYAVSVSDQDEEVHVFSGSVQRAAVSQGVRSSIELLSNGQAKRYPGSLAATDEVTEPVEFIRTVVSNPDQRERRGVAYEGFGYKNESTMMRSRANNGAGWDGPWRRNVPNLSGQEIEDPSLRIGESLVFGSKSEASRGRSLGYVGDWQTHRDLAQPIDLAANRVVYMSFLYRPSGMWKQGENNLKVLLYNPGEGAIEHRIAIALDAGHGLVRGALCGARRECPLPMADGATYLIVAKIASSADNPDQLMLRIFQPEEPVSRNEPASWTIITPTIHSDESFRMLSLRFVCQHEQRVDEIRVGSTWTSVTHPWAVQAESSIGELHASVNKRSGQYAKLASADLTKAASNRAPRRQSRSQESRGRL